MHHGKKSSVWYFGKWCNLIRHTVLVRHEEITLRVGKGAPACRTRLTADAQNGSACRACPAGTLIRQKAFHSLTLQEALILDDTQSARRNSSVSLVKGAKAAAGQFPAAGAGIFLLLVLCADSAVEAAGGDQVCLHGNSPSALYVVLSVWPDRASLCPHCTASGRMPQEKRPFSRIGQRENGRRETVARKGFLRP